MMLFISLKDLVRFEEYLKINRISKPKWIGKAVGTHLDRNAQYMYGHIDILLLDLTALKLMFDIRHSLF